jgi:hypothetical protein
MIITAAYDDKEFVVFRAERKTAALSEKKLSQAEIAAAVGCCD